MLGLTKVYIMLHCVQLSSVFFSVLGANTITILFHWIQLRSIFLLY